MHVCMCDIGFGTWQTVSVRMVDEEEEALLREEEARKEIEDAKQTTGNSHQSKVLDCISDTSCKPHQVAYLSLLIALKIGPYYYVRLTYLKRMS